MKDFSGNLLLKNKYTPLTDSLVFIDCSMEKIVEKFVEWQKKIFLSTTVPKSIVCSTINSSSLEQSLQSMSLVKEGQPNKFLFMETKSNWTAYFENGVDGTDGISYPSFLSKLLNCKVIHIMAVPHSSSIEGALSFDLFSNRNKGSDFLNLERSISLIHDSKWHFYASGEPLSFEKVEVYDSDFVTDKFTFDILSEYAFKMGISPFDIDFYIPEKSILVERVSI